MNITEAIYGCSPIREFTAQAISEASIRQLIDATVQARGGVIQPPWTFTVILKAGVLDQISRYSKAMLATMLEGSRSQHFRAMLEHAESHVFYHAPLLIVILASTIAPWISKTRALAAESVMRAAYTGGLGSYWIGLAYVYLNAPNGEKIVVLPAALGPIAPIIVGNSQAAPAPVYVSLPLHD